MYCTALYRRRYEYAKVCPQRSSARDDDNDDLQTIARRHPAAGSVGAALRVRPLPICGF